MATAKTTNKNTAAKKTASPKTAPKTEKNEKIEEVVKTPETVDETLTGIAEIIESDEETLVEGSEIGGNDIESVNEEEPDQSPEEGQEVGEEVGETTTGEIQGDDEVPESNPDEANMPEAEAPESETNETNGTDEVVTDVANIVASIEEPKAEEKETPVVKKKPVRRNYYNDRFGNAWNGMINTY